MALGRIDGGKGLGSLFVLTCAILSHTAPGRVFKFPGGHFRLLVLQGFGTALIRCEQQFIHQRRLSLSLGGRE